MNETKQAPLNLEGLLAQIPAPDLRGIDAGDISEWRDLIARGCVKKNELLVQVKDLPKILEKSYTRQFEALQQQNQSLMRDLQAAQAKIDALMLEYCPQDMSKAQIKDWADAQAPVDDSSSISKD
jgi:hypothetical protein